MHVTARPGATSLVVALCTSAGVGPIAGGALGLVGSNGTSAGHRRPGEPEHDADDRRAYEREHDPATED